MYTLFIIDARKVIICQPLILIITVIILLAGPLGQTRRRGRCLRTLRECRLPVRLMFWWDQCFSTVDFFLLLFFCFFVFWSKIFFDKNFFLTKKKKKNKKTTVLKHWSHRNINRAGERHSLRALKHRPRRLDWPEGPASSKLLY